MVGLAYIVISDKWEEHKLKRAAAAKAESDQSASEVPDTDIEGVTIDIVIGLHCKLKEYVLLLPLIRLRCETKLSD